MSSGFVYEVINPQTNRKVVIGGSTYRALVRAGILPDRPLLVVEGRRCLRAQDISAPSVEKFATKEDKLKALKEYKKQQDLKKQKKKAAKKVEDSEESLDEKIPKLKISKKPSKAPPKPKKEPVKPSKPSKKEIEYDSSSLSTSSSSS